MNGISPPSSNNLSIAKFDKYEEAVELDYFIVDEAYDKSTGLIKAWENIINIYAECFDLDFCGLNNIRLICHASQKAFDNLVDSDNRSGHIMRCVLSSICWEEIEKVSKDANLNEAEFRDKVSDILDKSPYVKIILPILDEGKQSIVTEVLFSKNKLKYLEFYSSYSYFNKDGGDSDLDKFLNQFIKFLEGNKDLKRFGILDFRRSEFNKSHVDKLLSTLRDKFVRKSVFDKKAYNRQNNKNIVENYWPRRAGEETNLVFKASVEEINEINEIEIKDIKSMLKTWKADTKLPKEVVSWERHYIDDIDEMPWLADVVPDSVLTYLSNFSNR